jgi:hypothetical protein
LERFAVILYRMLSGSCLVSERTEDQFTSRRCRLLCQIAIIDITDRDWAAGECATEPAGEFQGHAGVERVGDRLEIGSAGIGGNAAVA